MAGDRPRQPAIRNCQSCRASHELWSNYLLRAAVGTTFGALSLILTVQLYILSM